MVADLIAFVEKHLVPIHMHSDHSLGDGAQRAEDIAKRAAKLGRKACSLTDHGTMTGLYPFERACKKHGIKPLHGCEIYVDELGGTLDEIKAKNKELRKENKGKEWTDADRVQSRSHLVLLAKNDIGYRNLVRLNNMAVRDRAIVTKKAVPLVTWAEISELSEGLIASTACVASKLASLAIQDNAAGFSAQVSMMREVFGDDLFLELQLNSLDVQQKVNSWLLRESKAQRVPLVLGLDAHYQEKRDGLLRQLIMASMYKGIRKREDFFDANDRLIVDPDWNCWFKTPAEVVEAWEAYGGEISESDFREAVLSTSTIADRISFTMGSLVTGYKMPEVPGDADIQLRELVREGLRKRVEAGFIPEASIEQYVDRARQELAQIEDKGYSSYFIATYEAVEQSRNEHGVVIGPGRGSAAGSLINFALGITEPDPLRFGLSFERFLNPARGKIVADLGL